MPLVPAVLADMPDAKPGKTILSPASTPLSTRKRSNELLPEEI